MKDGNGTTLQWTSQQKAILHAPWDKHMCIIAGAGCAKTTTLLGRILTTIQSGVLPQRIMLATFSKDAADEMCARLIHWTGIDVPIVCGTFDAIARRYLKELDEDSFKDCHDVGSYKHAFLHFLQQDWNPASVELLNSIDHVFVDEYQDINNVYHGILEAFAQNNTWITGVGDDAQTIYSWNGSDKHYILNFGAHFHDGHTNKGVETQTFYLTSNFRCSPEILRLANSSIARNMYQMEKQIIACKPSHGQTVDVYAHTSWNHEATTVLPLLKMYHQAKKSIVVLCRNCTNNGPLYFYETQCAKYGIPCVLLEQHRDKRAQMISGCVALSTIHKSKGLEWDVVVVVGCMDKHFPGIDLKKLAQHDEETMEQLEEERRLFYVAATRAKEKLIFAYTDSGNQHICAMTRFLSEIPRQLIKWNYTHASHYVIPTFSVTSTTPLALAQSMEKMIEQLNDSQRLSLNVLMDIHFPIGQVRTQKLHNKQQVPDWVSDTRTSHILEMFGSLVLGRMHGCKQIQEVETLLHNIHLSKQEQKLFDKYKPQMESLMKKRPQVLSCDMVTKVEPADTININRLCYRLCRTPSSCTTVATNSKLPKDARNRFAYAYECFQSDMHWATLLSHIYLLSWCKQALHGRTSFLYEDNNTFVERANSLLSFCKHLQHYIIPDDAQIDLHSTYKMDNITDIIPLIYTREGKCVQFYVFVQEHDGLTRSQYILLVMHALARQQSTGSACNEIHVYFPQSGTLSVIPMNACDANTCSLVWSQWKALLQGKCIQRVHKDTRPIIQIKTTTWKESIAMDMQD